MNILICRWDIFVYPDILDTMKNEGHLCDVLDFSAIKMSDEDIKKNLNKIAVIARALPQDKSRMVSIIEDMDLVVGMTGDGVNDAPALKKANVGFAVGSGTEVAKEAADIVILDNNILSISKAIS